MTAQNWLALYGLMLVSACFVALFIRYVKIRNKLTIAEGLGRNAYDAGYKRGYEQANLDLQDGKERNDPTQ